MRTIAIDCGASFIKCALMDNEKIIKKEQRKAPAATTNDIFDTRQIESLIKIVEDVIVEYSKNETEICLSICNEMHGFILSDEIGKPLTSYISWQKEYGSIAVDGISSVDLLNESLPEEIRKTGMPLRSGLPSSNLLYLIRSKKQVNNSYFYTLGDYIIRRLTNQQPFCHNSNAAATGLYDITGNRWNQRLLECVCKDTNIVFPEISDKTIVMFNNGTKIIVYPAIGDQQAALLGSGLSKITDLSFNLGTGAQVSVLVNEKKPPIGDGYQIRPFFNNYYLKTVPHIPSGRSINVFVNLIKDILQKYDLQIEDPVLWRTILDSYSDEDCGLRIDLSFFENAITDHSIGSIDGITENNLTFSSLFSSIINQMSDNYLSVSDKIIVNDVNRIIFSGGIANRIEMIRKRIEKHYPHVETVCSTDETFIGLVRYISQN